MAKINSQYIKVVLTYTTDSAFKPHYSTTILLESDLEWASLIAAWKDGRRKFWTGSLGVVLLKHPSRTLLTLSRPPRIQ